MTNLPNLGLRAGPSALEVIDRRSPVRFSFNGRPVAALAGDTIVSALMASGIRAFAQGRRLQTKRGVLTADRFDPCCFLQVDDEPNVPAAHRLVVDGMRVRSQHVWPSLRFDLKAINQRATRALRPPSQLRASTAAGFLRPAYRWLTAHGDVGGRVTGTARTERPVRHVHPDVLVVGGGLSGLAAAEAASAAGARTLVVEADREAGGFLRLSGEPMVAELRRTLEQRDGLDLWTDSVVASLDEDGLAMVVRELPGGADELTVVHAAHVVLAPGVIERTATFPGNDLPGVMLAGGARRLLSLWRVRPGRRAVVLTANEHGDAAASELEEAGVEVATVVDARAGGGIRRAEGSDELERVHLNDGSTVPADLLVLAAGWTIDAAFLRRAGVRVRLDRRSGRPVVEGRPGSVAVVGSLAGDGPLEQVVAHATVSGRQAAAAVSRRLRPTGATRPSVAVEGRRAAPPQPPLGGIAGEQVVAPVSVGVVDFSEDLTAYELVDQDPVEGARLLGQAAGAPASNPRARAELSDLARRQPAVASLAEPLLMGEATPTCHLTGGVRLGALARLASRPLRRTPLVDEHVALGARLVPDGEWLDVADYGNPDAERRALVEGIGLRDTSRAALYDLQGLDAADLVHQLLPGLRLPTAGEVLVASSAGGWPLAVAGVGVEHWELRVEGDDARALEARLLTLLYIEHRQWEAYLTPLHESRASMALLGPRAGEAAERLLGRAPAMSGVMALDEANAAMGHVWSFTWHGQPTFELWVPAGYATAAWKALLSRGRDLDIRPVGLLAVEEQRDGATTGAASAAGAPTAHARTASATSADA